MKSAPTICIFLTGASSNDLEALAQYVPSLGESSIRGDLGFSMADKFSAMQVSAMTGCWPDQHGVLMDEVRDRETLGFRRLGGRDRRKPAFWERLALEGQAVVSVGWPHALPGCRADAAQVVDALFGSVRAAMPSAVFADTVSGAATGDLLEAWVRPEELPREVLASLAPSAVSDGWAENEGTGRLLAALAENVSRHAAFLELIQNAPWRVATLHLDLLAQLRTLAMNHPKFTQVVDNGLALTAELLSAVLHACPVETNVVLAGMPVEPAQTGGVLLRGPDFTDRGQKLSVSLLDLAPTLWALAGFVERRYPGRILMEALRPDVLASGRRFSGEWLQATGREPLEAEDACLETLLPSALSSRALYTPARLHAWQADWNLTLVRSLVARSAFLEVLPILERRVREQPEEADGIKILAEILLRAELFPEALEAAEEAWMLFPENDPDPLLLVASAYAGSGQEDQARKCLAAAVACAKQPTDRQRGADLLVWLEDWDALLAYLRTHEAALRPASRALCAAQAWAGLGQWESARDLALEAVNLNYANPRAHEVLGMAFWNLGDHAAAFTAFSTCVCLAPNRSWPFQLLMRYGRLTDVDRSDIERWQLQAAMAEDAEQKLIADYRALVASYRHAAPTAGQAHQAAPLQRAFRPVSIQLVTGLPGVGQAAVLTQLASSGVQYVAVAEADWPGYCGAGDELRLFESGAAYAPPLGLIDCLPTVHDYQVHVCVLDAAQITDEYVCNELSPALHALDRSELAGLLMRQQYWLIDAIRQRPNMSLRIVKRAPMMPI